MITTAPRPALRASFLLFMVPGDGLSANPGLVAAWSGFAQCEIHTPHQPQPLINENAVSLLPYQKEAIEALEVLRDAWQEGHHRSGVEVPAAMVSLPTGAGKTIMAVRWLLERVMPTADSAARRRVLWLAHTRDLLEQAEAAFHREATHDPDHRLLIATLGLGAIQN